VIQRLANRSWCKGKEKAKAEAKAEAKEKEKEFETNLLIFLSPIENKMSFRDFTSMPIWQKGIALLKIVYQITDTFPKEEKYSMVSDMRRSANSVVHNIAEGFGRYENKDKTRFYKISRGSAYEIISQSLASLALLYMNEEVKDILVNGYKEIIDEEDKLIKSIEDR